MNIYYNIMIMTMARLNLLLLFIAIAIVVVGVIAVVCIIADKKDQRKLHEPLPESNWPIEM